MSHNIHDATFKQVLSHEQHFVDFCKAYLPDDITTKINWQTLKLHKLNQEFIDHIQDKHQKHIADVVYAVNYRDKVGDRECLILVHSEHQSRPNKLLPLRLLHYKAALLLDYAKSNSKKPLPVVISVAYYHGQTTPYPYSMDIYDLFEDRDLAEAHLLNPKLVDLKQLPINELLEHGTLAPMEFLMQMTFLEMVSREDYQVFFETIIQLKDNQTVLESLKIMLYYATNVLKCDKQQFATDFIQRLPELEEEMQTLAQQWMEEGEERAAPKYRQEGRQEVAISMLKHGADINFVVKSSGLSRETVERLANQHKNNSSDKDH